MNWLNCLAAACALACSPMIAPLFCAQDISTTPHEEIDSLIIWSQGNKHFTTSFYSRAKESRNNVVFSPLSLQLGLAMTSELSLGMTQKEIIEKSALPEVEHSRRMGAETILDHLNPDDTSEAEVAKLILANGVWFSSDVSFSSSCKALLSQSYQAKLQQVNFRFLPEETGKEINTWVEEKTKHQIQNLIPQGGVDQQTKLMLVNTFYMRAPWAKPFNPAMTYKAPFYGIQHSSLPISYMRKIAPFGFLEEAHYSVIELPFHHLSANQYSLSLFIVLPDAESTLEEVEEDLTTRKLDHWIANTETRLIDLSLPKFKISSRLNAKEILKNMGMQRLFSAEAEFDLNNQHDTVVVTNIVHQAVFEVDEWGATGSAGTEVVIGMKSYKDSQKVVVNRPFLLFVADKTNGIILFAGRVIQPNHEQ
jgi:serpin B